MLLKLFNSLSVSGSFASKDYACRTQIRRIKSPKLGFMPIEDIGTSSTSSILQLLLMVPNIFHYMISYTESSVGSHHWKGRRERETYKSKSKKI
jgi:hypothetical protein